jgi:hypothetical protein
MSAQSWLKIIAASWSPIPLTPATSSPNQAPACASCLEPGWDPRLRSRTMRPPETSIRSRSRVPLWPSLWELPAGSRLESGRTRMGFVKIRGFPHRRS